MSLPVTQRESWWEKKLLDGGTPRIGAFRVTDDDVKPWPPKGRKPGNDLVSLMKRVHARLVRGRLVWLRDYDEEIVLAVARDKGGKLMANRYWPHYRPVTLEVDGRVSTPNNEGDYVRHWIAVEETQQLYMFIQNNEVYSEPLKDD